MTSTETEIEATLGHLAEATEALELAQRHGRETRAWYLGAGRSVIEKAMASVLRLTQQVNDPVVQFETPVAFTEAQSALAVPKRMRGKMLPERAHIFAMLEVLEVNEEVFIPKPDDMTIDQFVARVCNVQRRVKQDTNQSYKTEQNREKTGVHTIRKA